VRTSRLREVFHVGQTWSSRAFGNWLRRRVDFGTGKIADLGKGLGEGIKNFKNAMKDGENSDDKKS